MVVVTNQFLSAHESAATLGGTGQGQVVVVYPSHAL